MDNDEKTSLIQEKYSSLDETLIWFRENHNVFSTKIIENLNCLTDEGVEKLEKVFHGIASGIYKVQSDAPPFPFRIWTKDSEPDCHLECESCKFKDVCTVYKIVLTLLRTAAVLTWSVANRL